MIAALTSAERHRYIMILVLLSYHGIVLMVGSGWANIKKEMGLARFLQYTSAITFALIGSFIYRLAS